MNLKVRNFEDVVVSDAVLPDEVALSVGSQCSVCPGDGCNDDQGGCYGDSNCGQHC